jgi:Domain of unknown function (DUF5710)
MRINLACPYVEKDQAKSLGAKWDAARKVWYIENIEDLAPFMRWIPRESKPDNRISLREYLDQEYAGCHALTRKSAIAFGIPYPLEQGWAKRYANNMAKPENLTVGKRNKAKASKPKQSKPNNITGAYQPLCDCNVLAWDDCEHSIGDESSIIRQTLARV